MQETKEQILERMTGLMPWRLADQIKPYILEAMQTYANQQLLKHSVSVSDLVEIENAYIEDANNVLRGDLYTVEGRVSKCWILETDFDEIKCTHN